MSARSLASGIRLYLNGHGNMDAPNLSEDLFRQLGLQHEGNCYIAFNVSLFVRIQGIKETVRAGLLDGRNIPEACSLRSHTGERWNDGRLSHWRRSTGGKCGCQIWLTCEVCLHSWLFDRSWECCCCCAREMRATASCVCDYSSSTCLLV